MLLINVKGAFDHVSWSCFLHSMQEMGTDRNLMRWTESFKSDRSVRLVIDRHQCAEKAVVIGAAEGSPVSPIPFDIYLSRSLMWWRKR